LTIKRIENYLKTVSENLAEIESRREKVIKDSRAITFNASKAIVAIHKKDYKSSKNYLNESKTSLTKLSAYAGDDLGRYLYVPAGEYVEASVVMAVSKGRSIPTGLELNVPSTSYLHGLLDTIGELKRMVYDRIREDKSEDAIKLFDIMQQLFSLLSPFAEFDHVAKGIRRKIDVSRMLIEGTRAVVTEESRRQKFIKEINKIRLPTRSLKTKK